MHSMPCIIPPHTYGKYHSSILKLAIFGPLSIHPTKTLFWCIPTKPVIHRSSLHQLVISDKEKDYDILEEMLQVESIGAVVNRPNWEGKTAIYLAVQTNSRHTLLLWAAGAKPIKDLRLKGLLIEQGGFLSFGIQHVVECSALASTHLRERQAAEEKIKDLASVGAVKVVFVPPFGLNEEQKRELRKFAREWNKTNHTKGRWPIGHSDFR